jgi:hypothetical protein
MAPSQEEKKFPISVDLIAAEYTALREEILKLTDIQSQIVVITLVSFGTVLTVGSQIKSAAIILVYPVLALFLAIGWINNAHGIDLLGKYIQDQIEIRVGIENIGWEHFSKKERTQYSFIAFWGSRAIFFVTQILALIVGISAANFNVLTVLLIIVAFLSTILCAILFGKIAWIHRQGKRLVTFSPT